MPKQNLVLPAGRDINSVLQALTTWARNIDQSYVAYDELNLPTSQAVRSISHVVERQIGQQIQRAMTAQQVNNINEQATRNITRGILENSGDLPPIEVNAPELFRVKDQVDSKYLYIGAGGIGGGYLDAGQPKGYVATFGIGSADGSFYFGSELVPSKQISFDGVSGELTFGSDIKVNTVNQTLSTIASNASSGASAYAALSGKIDKNAAYVLGASSEFKTSGYDGGNGMNFTNNGIVARKAGVNTFVIASDGTATFAGALSAATGSFAGTLDVASDILINNGVTEYGRLQANGTLNAVALVAPSKNLNLSTGGTYYNHSGGSSGSIAMTFSGNLNVERSGGKYFRITSTGTFFSETPKVVSTSVSLEGHTHSEYASTSHTHSSLTNGGNTYTLSGGLTTGSATATFGGTNKPGSNSANGWITLVIDSTTLYIPAWT